MALLFVPQSEAHLDYGMGRHSLGDRAPGLLEEGRPVG